MVRQDPLGWKLALIVFMAVIALVAVCTAARSAQPWPFTPRQARLVMLMDEGHPARSSDGRQLWALTADLTYRTHAGDKITAPKGMVTDLASVPAVVQGLLPSDGDYAQGAVIHDFLFRTSGNCIWVFAGKRKDGTAYRRVLPSGCSRAKPYTRQEANQILDEAMVDLQVSTWRRWLIMDGLYVGSAAGWGH